LSQQIDLLFGARMLLLFGTVTASASVWYRDWECNIITALMLKKALEASRDWECSICLLAGQPPRWANLCSCAHHVRYCKLWMIAAIEAAGDLLADDDDDDVQDQDVAAGS
jgi:hypothetical protein